MRIPFTKMHALGNDYIIINGWDHGDLINIAPDLSRKMSDRHFGIGGDGIIFALPSNQADAEMRIFNADGSEAEMCGNGIRQVAKYIYDNSIVMTKELRINTLAGIKPIVITKTTGDGKMELAKVDMGFPILEPKKIGAKAEMNEKHFSTVDIESADKNFNFTLVSMGNPHAVTFIEKTEGFEVEKYGKPVEMNNKIFPKRTNVEFIEVINSSEINMRVWERGSGETLACGTGASASVVAAVLNGLTNRKVNVHLLGGDLEVEWLDGGTVFMTGGAEVAFNGNFIYEA